MKIQSQLTIKTIPSALHILSALRASASHASWRVFFLAFSFIGSLVLASCTDTEPSPIVRNGSRVAVAFNCAAVAPSSPIITTGQTAEVTWEALNLGVTGVSDTDITIRYTAVTNSGTGEVGPIENDATSHHFPVGEFLVTATAMYEAAGGSTVEDDCEFMVTVHPRVELALDCPDDILMSVDTFSDPLPVDLTLPTLSHTGGPPGVASDSLISVAVSTVPALDTPLTDWMDTSGDFDLGETVITYVATVDNDPSTIASVMCDYTVTINTPVMVDCSSVTLTPSSPRATFDDLMPMVTWTEPTIIVAGVMTIPTADRSFSYAVTPINGDIDSSTGTVPIIEDNATNAMFPVGEFRVTVIAIYTPADMDPIPGVCSFSVTVDPIIVSITVDCSAANPNSPTIAAEQTAEVTWTAPVLQVMGISDADVTIRYTAVTTSGTEEANPIGDNVISHRFPAGEFRVTATAVYEVAGEEMEGDDCEFTVTVHPRVELTLDCPTNIPMSVTTFSAPLTITLTPPTLSHTGGPPGMSSDTDSLASVKVSTAPALDTPLTDWMGTSGNFDLGETRITYVATVNNDMSESVMCNYRVTIIITPDQEIFVLRTNDASPSADNPFLIQTVADLNKLAEIVNIDPGMANNNEGGTLYSNINGGAGNYNSADYLLAVSLDFADAQVENNSNFTPIGIVSSPFMGTFNGSNREISNLMYNGSTVENVGLFGVIEGSGPNEDRAAIVDLMINDPMITNSHSGSTGALVGRALDHTQISSITIVGGNVQGAGIGTGGLAGYNAGLISNSSSSASTTATGTSANSTGGLVGRNVGVGAGVWMSSASGAVTGTGNSIGGLVGRNETGSILTSSASGTVTGTGTASNIGGLVGSNVGGNITSSAATGNVMGSARVGGLIGYNRGGSIMISFASGTVTGTGNSLGGFIGEIDLNGAVGSSIENTYATGAVTGESTSSNIGGLIGEISSDGRDGHRISNSYARGLVGAVDNSNAIGNFVGDDGGPAMTTTPIVTFSSSYWENDTASQSITIGCGRDTTGSADDRCLTASGVTGVTGTSAMALQQGTEADTYTDWLSSIWDFGSDSEYPALLSNDISVDAQPRN